MPLYDYVCPTCGHSFTVRQGFHDQPESACPRCGTASRRRLSIPAVVYRGSGFYTTDHGRRSGSASRESSDTSESPSASEGGHEGAPSETASDSHPHPH